MGNPRDPNRARRGTGHRPQAAVVTLAPSREPAPRPAWCEPPLDLPVGAVRQWEALVDELLPQGLREAQMPGVAAMATADLHRRLAAQAISDHGLLIQGEFGAQLNPALRAHKDAVATWTRVAAEFGITPAARLRLGLMQLEGETLLGQLDRDLAT